MLGTSYQEVKLVQPNPPSFFFTDKTLCKMNSLPSGQVDHPTFMSGVEAHAWILQRVNEEEARIRREWHQLSDAERRDEELAHELQCTLCGVPFDLPWSLPSECGKECFAWVNYFLARKWSKLAKADKRPANIFTVRILKDPTTGSATKVDITGIGQWDQQVLRLPPPGYDIRDFLRGHKPMGKIRVLMTEDEKKQFIGFDTVFENRYALDPTIIVRPSVQLTVDPRVGKKYPSRSIYLMHPRCWDILLQQYALVASPDQMGLDLNVLAKIFFQIPLAKMGGGFAPDWATDYGGPELIWWKNGLEDHGVGFDDAPQWHFLQRDPGIAYGFHELFINPPFESSTDKTGRTQFTDDGSDIFARLPEEVLTEIFVLLPSASVRDLQLASRRMASVHLSSRYWRSRFDFPNELCHITLPPAFKTSGQVGGQWVDWRRLCDQLHHPAGEKPGWWLNRKRITALNKQLAKSILLRDVDGRLKKGAILQ